MRKVLIVEDNKRVAQLINTYLEREGYCTSVAYDGARAMREYHSFKPDMLILDIMLPEKSGLDIARDIRKESTVPIIFVTARSDEEDKLRGLGVGADDYIVKPFSPKEMVARVEALFRRAGYETSMEKGDRRDLVFGGLRADLDNREIFLNEELIDLTALQFDLLIVFMKSPGRAFSREMLLEKLNAEVDISERSIDAHIKNIRKALGEPGKKDGLLKTVFGVGYKLG